MKKLTTTEAASIIERFIEDRSLDDYEWGDFITSRFEDPTVESVRLQCEAIPSKYPAKNRSEFCSEQGLEEMRVLVSNLREPCR
jgi:hypothetical protein